MLFRIMGPLAVLLALTASTANATDWCNGNGQIISVAGQAYVAVDCLLHQVCVIGDGAVYAETNSVPGLQRGGSDLTFGEPDSCQDSPDPDLFIAGF